METVEFVKEYFYFEILDKYGGPVLAVSAVLLFLAESYRRLRKLKSSRWKRIKRNLSIAFTAVMALRLSLIPALVYLALFAEDNNFGVFQWVQLPSWLVFVLGFVLLDYGNYLWHLLNHKINFLWRFHNVHHIDLDLDVTTALRFHFGEILLSIFFRGFMILLIGPPYWLVLTYEVIFETATLFHHSNWRIPYKIEKLISRIIVTPRMHGVHHSIVHRETNSNYSIIFNIWDRIHQSLRLNIPQDEINIGVPSYRDPGEQNIKNLLLMPFKKPRPWLLPDGKVPDRQYKGAKGNLEP
ncbi:sterol desaturase family protein [Zunongwangia sp. F363]|uniref:Sterol desaturase family protein n=1 Tax=Autumnicola tepida TaxID=3075595 RepID=A0ABU3CBR2_9FLAO|nr:sterol desaturase family protein [Zunongwangia sp. F363]MDT0643778.1 sterol desaturase family protein [Zunongwangia sp. F363]